MNLYKMLMMAAFSIMTFTAISQEKAGRKDTTNHPTFYTCPKHSDVKSEKAGNCSICGMKLELTPKEKMKMEVVKKYTCSMHSDVTSKTPGKCPTCNMDLVESKKAKHSEHH